MSNIAQIRPYDVANGEGIRVTVFVSGCTHHCKGCFNKEYQDFNYGKKLNESQILTILSYLEPTYIQGITFLGGEPFDNTEAVFTIIKRIKEKYGNTKDIWIYSGYTFEKLIQDEEKEKLLKHCDVLVDGKFIEELKDLKLKFAGSSNQRIIDLKSTFRFYKKLIVQKITE